MLYHHITELIGETPLLEIPEHVHGLPNIKLYAKLEYYNPFGSVKDRIAWEMLREDLSSIVDNKQTIIEASSGNTAKALQVLASIYGVPFQALTNRIKVSEVKDILYALGASVEEFSSLSECPDPTAFDGLFATLHKRVVAGKGKYYHPSQYTNKRNVDAHYNHTGPEIERDIGNVDYFVGGLGTTGLTLGAGRYLREQNADMEVIGVVSSADDFVPGIRSSDELWEVGLFEKKFYTDIVEIQSRDAIDASLLLAKRCGVLAGPTTGASFAAVLSYLRPLSEKLAKSRTAVFIACDRLEWYMSYVKLRRPDLFSTTQVATSRALDPAEIEEASEIEASELDKYIQNGCTVVDMRTNAQYRLMHIPGSVNIPDEVLETLISSSLPFSARQPVIVVCMVGKQSRRFAALLRKKGYEASSLVGGVLAWRSSGKKLESFV